MTLRYSCSYAEVGTYQVVVLWLRPLGFGAEFVSECVLIVGTTAVMLGVSQWKLSPSMYVLYIPVGRWTWINCSRGGRHGKKAPVKCFAGLGIVSYFLFENRINCFAKTAHWIIIWVVVNPLRVLECYCQEIIMRSLSLSSILLGGMIEILIHIGVVMDDRVGFEFVIYE